jgi:hypothetical protein
MVCPDSAASRNFHCRFDLPVESLYDLLILYAECMTAVNVSVKDRLTFSISVALGSTVVRSNIVFFHCFN